MGIRSMYRFMKDSLRQRSSQFETTRVSCVDYVSEDLFPNCISNHNFDPSSLFSRSCATWLMPFDGLEKEGFVLKCIYVPLLIGRIRMPNIETPSIILSSSCFEKFYAQLSQNCQKKTRLMSLVSSLDPRVDVRPWHFVRS